MIDRHSSDQHGAEHKALREAELRLVHQRDQARGWVVRLESMLEGTCQLLQEYGRGPCLDCHRGETVWEFFDPSHHDPECRIAKVLAEVLADADTDRGGR
jgi:hypothetical protein